MNKLKYLLFLMIIFVSPVVFALDYDVTSQITSPVAPSGVGTYTGEENNGATYSYNIRTTYDGTLQAIRFNLPVPSNFVDGTCFSNNIEYKVTMYMADNDWRNRFGSVFVGYSSSSNDNFSNGNVTFVSMRQIYFTFKIPTGNTYCHNSVYVNLRSSDLFIPFTGDTNWNLSSVILTDPTTSSGGSSGSGSTNQDIIDNQTNNTNNIITNNNSNSTNIIDNNNQNTQSIIDNQNQNTNTINSSIENVLGSNCQNNLFNSNNIFQGFVSDNVLTANSGTRSYYFLGTNNTTYSIQRFDNGSGLGTRYTAFVCNGITSGSSCSDATQGNTSNNRLTITTGSSGNQYVFVYVTNNVSSLPVLNIFSGSNSFTTSYTNSFCSSKLDDLKDQQNQNTQQQIESQKVCKLFDKNSIKENGYLVETGRVVSGSLDYGITDYIDINNATINVLQPYTSNYNFNYCFYDINKSVISCSKLNTLTGNVTIPSNSRYFRSSINILSNLPQFEICKNGNQALTDNITDPNVDNDTGTGFFDNFTDEDFGLSQIITIPLNTIQSLTSKTCSPLQIPIPFTNSNVTLPCMTELYETKFPTIYNLWKIVSFGIIAYLISIDIFHIVKGFKDPESDKVEVLDL